MKLAGKKFLYSPVSFSQINESILPIFLERLNRETALDSNTEEKILSNLLNDKKDATVIIVSQSAKSIKNCDKIIVLSQNGVESQGTHNELLETSAYYSKVVKNQLGEVSANG